MTIKQSQKYREVSLSEQGIRYIYEQIDIYNHTQYISLRDYIHTILDETHPRDDGYPAKLYLNTIKTLASQKLIPSESVISARYLDSIKGLVDITSFKTEASLNINVLVDTHIINLKICTRCIRITGSIKSYSNETISTVWRLVDDWIKSIPPVTPLKTITSRDVSLPFDNLSVSIITVIVFTNLHLYIRDIFNHMVPYSCNSKSIQDYIDDMLDKQDLLLGKTTKRTNKLYNMILNDLALTGVIPDKSIITIRYYDKLKGFGSVTKQQTTQRHFRNSLNLRVVIDKRIVNLKIPAIGKIQIAGCNSEKQAMKTIIMLWDTIRDWYLLYSIIKSIPTNSPNTNELFAVFRTVMANTNVVLDFQINRTNLDRYINTNYDHKSLYETSFGYAGVNIKMLLEQDPNFKLLTLHMDTDGRYCNIGNITYSEYFKQYINKHDQMKEMRKKRYVTFLVFHSGSIIATGLNEEYKRPFYKIFQEILLSGKDVIMNTITT